MMIDEPLHIPNTNRYNKKKIWFAIPTDETATVPTFPSMIVSMKFSMLEIRLVSAIGIVSDRS